MTGLIVKSSNKAEHQAARAILQEALYRQKNAQGGFFENPGKSEPF